MITHRVLPKPSLVNVFFAFMLSILLGCIGVALLKVCRAPIEEKFEPTCYNKYPGACGHEAHQSDGSEEVNFDSFENPWTTESRRTPLY